MPDRNPKHLLLLAPTAFTLRRLEELADADRYCYHAVLDYDQVISNEPRGFCQLLAEAREKARATPRLDGVLAFWDFPVTSLAPCLSRELGLPAPTLESVLQCEHKYWARSLQKQVAPDVVPPFERFDPFDDTAFSKLSLDPPFWIKPIKSASSQLGFRIDTQEDFTRAIGEIRQRIHIYGDSFHEALQQAELPDEIRRLGSNYCIAEGLIGGEEATLEGYVQNDAVHFHGTVDSIRHTNRSTFSRYQYPSSLEPSIIDRMQATTRDILQRIGYDNGTFNAEFFYDETADRIWLVEINPRISQSHAKIFQLVDGTSNFSELVSVALGETPAPRPGGPYPCAAKLFYRTVLEDAIVTAVPSPEEILAIEKRIGGVEIQTSVSVGTRLSDLPCQDSYSYELAYLHIGGDDEGDILQKYQECIDHLTFTFKRMQDTDLADGHHRVNAVPQLMRRKPSGKSSSSASAGGLPH